MSPGDAGHIKFGDVVGRFQVWGDFVEAVPYGSGHINDTFKVAINMAGAPLHYLLQRINHRIFKDPLSVMDNIVRVTNHVRDRLTAEGLADVTRRSLCVVFSRDAQPCYQDADGDWWRMYLCCQNAA